MRRISCSFRRGAPPGDDADSRRPSRSRAAMPGASPLARSRGFSLMFLRVVKYLSYGDERSHTTIGDFEAIEEVDHLVPTQAIGVRRRDQSKAPTPHILLE